MPAFIVIHHGRRAFYCWRHDRHFPWAKLNYCFCRGCEAMCLPPRLTWRIPARGLGLPVPLPRRGAYAA